MTTATEELEAPAVEEPTSAAVDVASESTATPEEKAAPSGPLPEHVQEHYDAIREKGREVDSLEDVYMAAKEAAADAKKELEAAEKALRRLIARGSEPLPLFDQPTTKELRTPKRIKLTCDVPPLMADSEHNAIVDWDGAVSVEFPAGDGVDGMTLEPEEYEVIEWLDPAPTAPAESDEWRKAAFAELGLSAKQNELFEAAGVTTIGQLEDLRADIANRKAVWPKGIGLAKQTDIENRVISWLDKNRDKFGEPIQPASQEAVQELADKFNGNGKH